MNRLAESASFLDVVHYAITGFLMVAMFLLAVMTLVLLVIAVRNAFRDYADTHWHAAERRQRHMRSLSAH